MFWWLQTRTSYDDRQGDKTVYSLQGFANNQVHGSTRDFQSQFQNNTLHDLESPADMSMDSMPPADAYINAYYYNQR